MSNELTRRELEYKVGELEEKMRYLVPEVRVLRTLIHHFWEGKYIPFTLKPFYTNNDGSILGDLMTLDEFEERVDCGAFIDYDGYGRFATETEESDIEIVPSVFRMLRHYADPKLTHVIWFNK